MISRVRRIIIFRADFSWFFLFPIRRWTGANGFSRANRVKVCALRSPNGKIREFLRYTRRRCWNWSNAHRSSTGSDASHRAQKDARFFLSPPHKFKRNNSSRVFSFVFSRNTHAIDVFKHRTIRLFATQFYTGCCRRSRNFHKLFFSTIRSPNFLFSSLSKSELSSDDCEF